MGVVVKSFQLPFWGSPEVTEGLKIISCLAAQVNLHLDAK